MNRLFASLLIFSAVCVHGAELEKAKTPSEKVAPPTAGETFKLRCASCHGKDAKGGAAMAKMYRADPAVFDLTSKTTQAMKDEELAAVILKGRKKMPKFEGKLTEDEVKAMVGYLRTLVAKKETPKAEAKEGSMDGKK